MEAKQEGYSQEFHDSLKELDQDYSKEEFSQLLEDPRFNYSLGSVVGACIGDALGSYCEFDPTVDEETMKKGISIIIIQS